MRETNREKDTETQAGRVRGDRETRPRRDGEREKRRRWRKTRGKRTR